MLGQCHSPPPPSPSPSADNPKEDDNLYFEEDDNEGNLGLAALNMEFRANEE
jgi:hypothetical protein